MRFASRSRCADRLCVAASGPRYQQNRCKPRSRRAVAGALAQVAASLTPTEVRRLIAMRNWRPENERTELDAIIRKARAAGIDWAPWEAGSIEAIVASAVDGATAQGFRLISPVARRINRRGPQGDVRACRARIGAAKE